MRTLRRSFFGIALFLVAVGFSPPTYGEFAKLISISGGSGQRLSSSMAASGYTGPSLLDEITICVPNTDANIEYIGFNSTVNASNGFPLNQGDCITYRAAGRAIDSSRIWLWNATSQSVAISLRER